MIEKQKRFNRLKIGDQFTDGFGWDMIKIGRFSARIAHARLGDLYYYFPWSYVEIITPNPNCDPDCPCRDFEQNKS